MQILLSFAECVLKAKCQACYLGEHLPHLKPPLWEVGWQTGVALQLHIHLEMICFLGSCQTSFHYGYSKEAVLTALVAHFH